MPTFNRKYARPLAFTGTAIVALVVIVVVIALPNSTSGTAQSTTALAATRALDTATGPFASSNAVSYSGTVTAGELTLRLDELAVSAAGDASGTVGVDGAAADYRQTGSAAIAKGPETFWRALVGQQTGDEKVAVPDTSTWAHIDLTRFPDLASLLTPSRLATLLVGEQKGGTVGSDATPDARFRAATDPSIRRTSDTSFVVGDTTATLDDSGKTLAGVKGRIGSIGSGSAATSVVADLRVTVRLGTSTGAIYDDLTAQAGDLAHAVAPSATVSLSRSTARPAPGPCNPPNCDVDVAIVAVGPAQTGLTVVANATVGFELRGRAVGRPCVRTVAMGRNATLRFRCAVTALPPPNGSFTIRPRFSAAIFADTPPATIAARLKAGQAMSSAAATGTFRRAGVKNNADAASYNTQITGLPSLYTYEVNGYGFDGRASDGVLLVTRGPGYASHLDSGGALESTWPGYPQLMAQAKAQKAAAGDTPIRWVFAEKTAATATATALAANDITGLEVVTVPAVK